MTLSANQTNNATAPIKTSIGAGSLTVVAETGYGSRFPASNFPLTLEKWDTTDPTICTKREIVWCTSRSGDICTITRSYDYCPASDAALTQTNTAFAFDAGDTMTLSLVAKTLDDIKTDVNLKLLAAGGLRTGFGANKHVRVNTTTGAEESKTVAAAASIGNTDKLRVEDGSTGDYKDVPYSAVKADMSTNSSKQVTAVAGEAITANDFVYEETLHTFVSSYVTTVPSAGQSIGDAAANTKVSLKFIGSGVAASTLKMGLNKAAAPGDNCIVRIETDNGSGNPSGSLVHANATSTISGASLSTGSSEVTVTFGGSFTCAANTPYHVVISRSGANDAVNFYQIPIYVETVRGFLMNIYNASWGVALTTQTYGMIFAGAVTTVVCKTSATNANQTLYLGYVASAAVIGASVSVITEKGANTFSGLTVGSPYYLSNTAGLISASVGTNTRMVGVATATTTVDIMKAETNRSLYENRAAQYTTIYNTAGKFHFRASYPCTMLVTITGTSVLSVGQVAKTSGVAFDMLPGDLLYAYGGTTLSVQILNKVEQSGVILT